MTLPKMNKKRYLYAAIAVILVFLFFRYWDNLAAFIHNVYSAFVPIIAGAIIAYILNILMHFYESHYFVKKNPPFAQKTRKAVCLIGAILTVLIVFALIISLIAPQLISCIKLLVQKFPKSVELIVEKVESWDWLPDAVQGKVNEYANMLLNINWSQIMAKVTEFLKTGFASGKGNITAVLSSTASGVVAVVVGIIFSIYFLVCKKQICAYANRVSAAYFRSKWMQRILRLAKSFNEIFHKYIVAECVEAVILGLLCLICMSILRLPYAPMISALVMIMALIPIVGSTISAVVGTLMILSVSPLKALIFFVMLMVIQVIEGNVIYPKVVGKGVGTPGIVVLGAVTVGGSIFGVLGMLIGVPVATTVWNEFKRALKRKEEKNKAQGTEEQPSEAESAALQSAQNTKE